MSKYNIAPHWDSIGRDNQARTINAASRAELEKWHLTQAVTSSSSVLWL